MEFEALKFPTPWPPPQLEERGKWHRVPILGWIVREIHRVFIGDKVARGIEADIVAQLDVRPSTSSIWPTEPTARRIVEALGKSVALEKGLQHDCVALHPDDHVVLLLWGYFDDLTPVIFCESVKHDVGVDFDCTNLAEFIKGRMDATAGSVKAFLNSRVTVSELIAFVAARPRKSKLRRSVWK